MVIQLIRSLYEKLEDGFYSLLDTLEGMGVPVYRVHDFLDERGIPPFPFFLALLLLLLSGILFVSLPSSTADLAVYVYTDTGDPIQGASVYLYDTSGELVASVYTDEEGGAYFASIEKKDYYVEVFAEGFEKETSLVALDDSKVVEVTLSPSPGTSDISLLTVVVTNTGGEPIPNAKVVAEFGDQSVEKYTDEEGKAEFRVPVGYTVKISASDPMYKEKSDEIVVDQDREMVLITLELKEGARYFDGPQAEDGTQSFTVAVNVASNGTPVPDIPVELISREAGKRYLLNTDENGRTLFNNITQSVYVLKVEDFTSFPFQITGNMNILVDVAQRAAFVEVTFKQPDGTPLSNSTFVFNGFEVVTDENGKALIPVEVFDGRTEITVPVKDMEKRKTAEQTLETKVYTLKVTATYNGVPLKEYRIKVGDKTKEASTEGASFVLPEGTYRVFVSGYGDSTYTDVELKEDVEVNIELPNARSEVNVVTSVPCTLEVEGNTFNISPPYTIVTLTPGEYNGVCTFEEYKPVTLFIDATYPYTVVEIGDELVRNDYVDGNTPVVVDISARGILSVGDVVVITLNIPKGYSGSVTLSSDVAEFEKVYITDEGSPVVQVPVRLLRFRNQVFDAGKEVKVVIDGEELNSVTLPMSSYPVYKSSSGELSIATTSDTIKVKDVETLYVMAFTNEGELSIEIEGRSLFNRQLNGVLVTSVSVPKPEEKSTLKLTVKKGPVIYVSKELTVVPVKTEYTLVDVMYSFPYPVCIKECSVTLVVSPPEDISSPDELTVYVSENADSVEKVEGSLRNGLVYYTVPVTVLEPGSVSINATVKNLRYADSFTGVLEDYEEQDTGKGKVFYTVQPSEFVAGTGFIIVKVFSPDTEGSVTVDVETDVDLYGEEGLLKKGGFITEIRVPIEAYEYINVKGYFEGSVLFEKEIPVSNQFEHTVKICVFGEDGEKVENAEVKLDNISLSGTGNCYTGSVSRGVYTLYVTAPGYEEFNKEVIVRGFFSKDVYLKILKDVPSVSVRFERMPLSDSSRSFTVEVVFPYEGWKVVDEAVTTDSPWIEAVKEGEVCGEGGCVYTYRLEGEMKSSLTDPAGEVRIYLEFENRNNGRTHSFDMSVPVYFYNGYVNCSEYVCLAVESESPVMLKGGNANVSATGYIFSKVPTSSLTYVLSGRLIKDTDIVDEVTKDVTLYRNRIREEVSVDYRTDVPGQFVYTFSAKRDGGSDSISIGGNVSVVDEKTVVLSLVKDGVLAVTDGTAVVKEGNITYRIVTPPEATTALVNVKTVPVSVATENTPDVSMKGKEVTVSFNNSPAGLYHIRCSVKDEYRQQGYTCYVDIDKVYFAPDTEVKINDMTLYPGQIKRVELKGYFTGDAELISEPDCKVASFRYNTREGVLEVEAYDETGECTANLVWKETIRGEDGRIVATKYYYSEFNVKVSDVICTLSAENRPLYRGKNNVYVSIDIPVEVKDVRFFDISEESNYVDVYLDGWTYRDGKIMATFVVDINDTVESATVDVLFKGIVKNEEIGNLSCVGSSTFTAYNVDVSPREIYVIADEGEETSFKLDIRAEADGTLYDNILSVSADGVTVYERGVRFGDIDIKGFTFSSDGSILTVKNTYGGKESFTLTFALTNNSGNITTVEVPLYITPYEGCVGFVTTDGLKREVTVKAERFSTDGVKVKNECEFPVSISFTGWGDSEKSVVLMPGDVEILEPGITLRQGEVFEVNVVAPGSVEYYSVYPEGSVLDTISLKVEKPEGGSFENPVDDRVISCSALISRVSVVYDDGEGECEKGFCGADETTAYLRELVDSVMITGGSVEGVTVYVKRGVLSAADLGFVTLRLDGREVAGDVIGPDAYSVSIEKVSDVPGGVVVNLERENIRLPDDLPVLMVTVRQDTSPGLYLYDDWEFSTTGEAETVYSRVIEGEMEAVLDADVEWSSDDTSAMEGKGIVVTRLGKVNCNRVEGDVLFVLRTEGDKVVAELNTDKEEVLKEASRALAGYLVRGLEGLPDGVRLVVDTNLVIAFKDKEAVYPPLLEVVYAGPGLYELSGELEDKGFKVCYIDGKSTGSATIVKLDTPPKNVKIGYKGCNNVREYTVEEGTLRVVVLPVGVDQLPELILSGAGKAVGSESVEGDIVPSSLDSGRLVVSLLEDMGYDAFLESFKRAIEGSGLTTVFVVNGVEVYPAGVVKDTVGRLRKNVLVYSGTCTAVTLACMALNPNIVEKLSSAAGLLTSCAAPALLMELGVLDEYVSGTSTLLAYQGASSLGPVLARSLYYKKVKGDVSVDNLVKDVEKYAEKSDRRSLVRVLQKRLKNVAVEVGGTVLEGRELAEKLADSIIKYRTKSGSQKFKENLKTFLSLLAQPKNILQGRATLELEKGIKLTRTGKRFLLTLPPDTVEGVSGVLKIDEIADRARARVQEALEALRRAEQAREASRLEKITSRLKSVSPETLCSFAGFAAGTLASLAKDFMPGDRVDVAVDESGSCIIITAEYKGETRKIIISETPYTTESCTTSPSRRYSSGTTGPGTTGGIGEAFSESQPV